MTGNPLTAIRFHDVFLKPSQSTFTHLPHGLAIDSVLSLTNKSGLIPSKAAEKLQVMGRKLYRTVIRNPKAFAHKLKLVQKRHPGCHTRIWIELHRPVADAQPWEVLCDPIGGPRAFLACHRTTPVLRTLERPESGDHLEPLAGPIGILGVIASPKGWPRLAVEKEKAALSRALHGLVGLGLVQIRWIRGKDTATKLTHALNHWPCHVFHFIGHGDFDPAQSLGVLIFEDANGNEHRIAANLVASALAGRSVRLAVLNTCRGAFAGKGGLLTSIAARLAKEVPAVVGMQTAISDRAAVKFSREFYESLTEGLPVELAVTEARWALAALSDGGHNVIEWPAPVLYLSSMHDVLDLKTLKAAKLAAAAGDPQKNQWGGSPSSRRRAVTATVKRIDRRWYRIELAVAPRRGAAPLKGPVVFHLPDSFADPVQSVRPKGRAAKLTLLAYRPFTIGVEADGGRTRLELDLRELQSAPSTFRKA